MKHLSLVISVIISAIIIAFGSYVVSSGTELVISDSLRQLSLSWYQRLSPAADADNSPVITELKGTVEEHADLSEFMSLSGRVNLDSWAQPGDLFLDVDGHFSSLESFPKGGSDRLYNSFGYEYAVSFDYDNLTYQMHRLDASSAVLQVAADPENLGVRPFRYLGGGTPVGEPASFGYPSNDEGGSDKNATDSDVPGTQTQAAIGLPQADAEPFSPAGNDPTDFVETPQFFLELPLPDDLTDIPLPATSEHISADPLSGDRSREGPNGEAGPQPVPEPATWLLLGFGLLVALLARKSLS